jgi:[protein-PII] uridylyltransferase
MPVNTHEDFDELATAISDPGWDYLSGLPVALSGAKQDIAAFRAALTEGDNRLKQRFHDDEPVERLVRGRARLVDTLLRTAWAQHLGEHARELALIAVGG